MAYTKKNLPSVSERFSAEAKDATAKKSKTPVKIPDSSNLLKRPPKPKKVSAGPGTGTTSSAGKKTNPGYYGQKKKQGLAAEAKRKEDLASGRIVIPPTTQPTTPSTPKAKAARVIGPGNPAPKQRAWYKPIVPGKAHKKRKKLGDAYIG